MQFPNQDNCFRDFIDPKQYFHPTRMSINGEGDNEDTEYPPPSIPNIAIKIIQGSDQYQSAIIYRVPENLRKQNKSAYTPCLIAVGPLHRDNPQLPKTMEHVKMHYATSLISRLTEGRGGREKDINDALEHCLEKMKDIVDKAKKYYAEEAKLSDDDMMEMLALDGCFILELLYANHVNMLNAEAGEGQPMANPTSDNLTAKSSSGQGTLDPIFDAISTGQTIKQDLLLLENQIPFFVLVELFELTVAKIQHRPHNCSLTDCVLSYFQDIMSPKGKSSHNRSSTISNQKKFTRNIEPEKVYHILHLLQSHYLPENMEAPPFSCESISASDLDYAGVKFASDTGKNLFDVKFNDNKGPFWWSASVKFEIPTLNVHGSTEPLFRNLIAMEQCSPGLKPGVTSYAKLMDMLINSEKDVKVLTKAKVINNNLSTDNDVFHLFNNLCKEVVIGEFYFNDACQRASKYSDRLWPQYMTSLKRRYFASPLKFIGFCLAVIVLGMQITQTIFIVK